MFKIQLLIIVVCFTHFITSRVSSASQVHQTRKEFTEEALLVHNEHRIVHNGKGTDLVLDDELSKQAQEKSEDAARDADVLKDVGPGESTFMACSTYNRALTGREVTDSWYDEVCHPNFSFDNPDNKLARSFTQVVWKDTRKLGIGLAVTRKEHTICTYAIALYRPTGNIADFYRGNVTKGSFHKDEYCKNIIDEDEAKSFQTKKIIPTDAKTRVESNGTQFTLNKSPRKPSVNRRTLYYKIPVNFITSVNTGSTYAVPLERQSQLQVNAARRSDPSPRSTATADAAGDNTEAQMDAINYGYAYDEKSATVKPKTEDSPPSTGYESVDNGDVQADYIGEKLAQHTDVAPSGNLQSSNYFGAVQPSSYENDSTEPSLETMPMMTKQAKRTVEDEYTLNKVALNVHNALRRMHGAPPLTLSAKMSIDAENYARYLAEENKFEHFKHLGDIGESLAFSCNTDERIPSVWKAIKDWYEEVCTKNYDFASSSQTDIKDIAHFTQIVWKSTRELGIGRSIARRGNETCTFFVARYNPSGNWLGQYKSNVLQGTFNSDICEKLDDVVEQMASLPNEEDDEEISLSPQTTALPLSAAVPQEKLDGATARPEGSLEKNDTPELRPVAEAEEVKSDQEQEKEAKPIKKPAAIKVNNSTNIGDSEDENVVGNCRFWSADVLSKFASNSLKVHNYFRKLHNSPPLEIDKELVRQAFNGAKALCISDTERRSIANKDVGENVDIACSHDDSRVSAADSVTNWYKQVCDTAYNFKTHKPAKGDSGRFTQLVWRKSKAFGTAFVTKKKTDGMFCTYAVAKYSPAGNTPGAFKDNVAQGTFSPSICSSLNTMANNAAVQAERSGNIITPAHAHLFKGLGTFKEQVDNHAIKGSLHNVANFDSKPTAQHSNHILLKQKHNPRLKVQQILGAMNKKKSLCAKAGIANGICRAALEVQSLVLHNEFRRIHEAGNLRISSELSTAARESAMKIIKDRTLGASQSGENVAVRCRASFTVQEAINDWYKEVCDSKYDFTEEGNQGASHFSQLVWKSTTSFGVGKAFGNINGAPCIVIVAKYEPAGNILGAFRDNVKQGKFKRESCDSLRKLTEEMISDQKPMAVPQAGNNTNSVVVDNKKPAMKIKKPAENNGINPKAGQHGPSKTMPGETPSGAKQPIKKPKAISNVMLIPHVPTEAEAKEFNDECLDVHNALRAMHDAEELHSSPDLVKKAQRIAEKSIIANTMSTARKRELTNSHGQNTILVCDPVKTEYTAENLILQWYKEVCTGKPFINGAYRGILDHFTQIVWKGSTQFGMAKASLSSGLGHCTIAVALYREAGNYLGQARDNVKQGDFDAEKCEFPEIILAEAREKYRELKAKPIIPPTTRSPEGLMTSPTPVTQFTEAQTTIKPIVKTMKPDADKEEEQKPTLSPKTTIMPVGKTEKPDTDKEEEQKPTPSPQTTIKPIVKTMRPDADKEEEQKPTLSPKTTIMPVGKTEKSDTDKEEEQKPTPSPQTTIKPIVKTMKPDEVNEEEQKPTTKPKTTKVPTIKTVKPNGDEEEDQKPTTKPKTTVATTLKTEKPNEDSDDNVKPTASPKTTQDPRVPVSSNIENETHKAGTNATDDGYASQGLEAHNTFRKIHNADEMVLDNEMSVGCEEYAKTLARSDSFVLQHSDSEDGENIAFKCAPASEMSGKEATKNWYEEVCNKDYDFSSNIHTTSTGHYTQVVWKSSKKFGIGRHVKRKGPLICTYVVARYRPPGNVDGKYNDNVKRGSFDKDETCKKLDELAGIKADKRTIIKPTIKRNKVESNRELPTSRIVNEEAGDANLNVRA